MQNGPASMEKEDSGPPTARRILVMSPHPDDDVISMGGTLARLCQQGNEVSVLLLWDMVTLECQASCYNIRVLLVALMIAQTFALVCLAV